MGLLDTIRSWLGIGGNGSDRREQVERRTTDVRVEHDPEESADVDATSEALVKGTDDSPEHDEAGDPDELDEAVTAGTDAAASTDSLTEEPPDPDAATEPAEPAEGTTVTDHAGTEREAAEPAEAAGPTPDEPDVDVEPEDAAPEPSTETGVAESGSVAESEEVDETEETDGTDDGTDAGSEPVDSISGIGQAYGKRLSDAGVETVADLAGADSAELADASGISEKRITDWQEAADDRLG
jgi:predicted flap endonuclease-1-like 5' DNA nuclease